MDIEKKYTSKGIFHVVKIKLNEETAAVSSDQSQQSSKETKMTIYEAHSRLGHLSCQNLRITWDGSCMGKTCMPVRYSTIHGGDTYRNVGPVYI
jgi:hypothetical protein